MAVAMRWEAWSIAAMRSSLWRSAGSFHGIRGFSGVSENPLARLLFPGYFPLMVGGLIMRAGAILKQLKYQRYHKRIGTGFSWRYRKLEA